MTTALPERYNASVLLDSNLAAGRAGKVAIYCGAERGCDHDDAA